MDPITLGMTAVGLGMQVMGGIFGSEKAGEISEANMDIARQEQAINDKKQQAMEMDASRQSLEMMRKNQQFQSLAQTRATGQGAEKGSGLQGGLAEIENQSLFNLQGVNMAVGFGRQINSLNQNISSDKIKIAQAGGQMAADQGFASLGGAFIKAGPIVGQLGKGFGSIGTNPGGPYV